jgi:hypothetical protein
MSIRLIVRAEFCCEVETAGRSASLALAVPDSFELLSPLCTPLHDDFRRTRGAICCLVGVVLTDSV